VGAYGTLADLRIAMTLDPTLIDTINANLPNLDVPKLAALQRSSRRRRPARAVTPMAVPHARCVKPGAASAHSHGR
jgi:hypothetical protein